MSNIADLRNGVADYKVVGHGLGSLTAAGTGDTTAIVGEVVNRVDTYGWCETAKLNVGFKTSLTADKTLGLKVTIEQSSNGTDFDTAVYLFGSSGAYETVATGAVTNKKGSWQFDLDLTGYKQYFRITVTPDLSHSGTDTAVVAHETYLGGCQRSPITINDTVTLY